MRPLGDANVVSSQSRAETSSRPANSTRPSRPSLRHRLPARARRRAATTAPCRGSPNARSAFGKNSSSSACQPRRRRVMASSSAALRLGGAQAGTRSRRPGTSVAVGSSVFRYSRPCRARSSPSCACAAPPTQSGCHALKTSCWKPGSVISAVLIAPPNQSLRSSTQTFQPRLRQQRGARQAVDPRPDDDRVVRQPTMRPELVVGDEPPLLRRRASSPPPAPRRAAPPGTSRPSSSALMRIESSPLFLPRTIERCVATSSDEYGSIDGGSWNCEATAPDLAPVERLAGDRLPRLELVAGQLAHALGHGADQLEAKVRLDPVEGAERQRGLAEVCVAGALPMPLIVPALAAPRAPRRQRSRRDAEVVVPVEVHRHVDELDRVADELRDRFRRGDADRVDDDYLLRARLDGRAVDGRRSRARRARSRRRRTRRECRARPRSASR